MKVSGWSHIPVVFNPRTYWAEDLVDPTAIQGDCDEKNNTTARNPVLSIQSVACHFTG